MYCVLKVHSQTARTIHCCVKVHTRAMLFSSFFFSWWNGLHLHLGFVYPLQDVALHQCLPSSSVCCFPNPGGSLLLCYVILPSSAWSSSRPLPSPWLPLCASLCPPIVLLSCYMTGPFPLLFQCVFYDIDDLCSFF